MNIQLHIERVVLDEVPVSVAQRPVLQAAMVNELTQLLQAGGLSDELKTGVCLPQARAGVVQMNVANNPTRLGAEIARAVHDGLGRKGETLRSSAGRPVSAEKRRPLRKESSK